MFLLRIASIISGRNLLVLFIVINHLITIEAYTTTSVVKFHSHRTTVSTIPEQQGVVVTTLLRKNCISSEYNRCSKNQRTSHLFLVPSQANQLIAASGGAYGIQSSSYDNVKNTYTNEKNNNENDENGDVVDVVDAVEPIKTPRTMATMKRAVAASTVARDLVSSLFALPSALVHLHDDYDSIDDYEFLHEPYYEHIHHHHNHQQQQSQGSSSSSSINTGSSTSTASTSTSTSTSPWTSEHGHSSYLDRTVQYYPVVGFVFVKDSPNHSRPLPTISNASCPLHYENYPNYNSDGGAGTSNNRNKPEELYGWFTTTAKSNAMKLKSSSKEPVVRP